jgi:hypothetical protein
MANRAAARPLPALLPDPGRRSDARPLPLPPLAAQQTAKARHLVGPPTRWGGRNLPWNERTDSGDVETMMCHLLDDQNLVARAGIRVTEME